MRSAVHHRSGRAFAALFFFLTITGGLFQAGPAEAGWWGGGLEFKLGWPPIKFSKWGEAEPSEDMGGFIEESLTAQAWERSAPVVRGIATGDTRDDIETMLGARTYEVTGPDGGSRSMKVADGYIGPISTPRRMEFGYIVDHLVIRKWSVRLDESGRVTDTAVFPDGRNDALLAEERLDGKNIEGLPVSAYALDYRLARVRDFPFLSKSGWQRANAALAKIGAGDSRLEVERAVDGRYYLYGDQAFFMANGFLPEASGYDAGSNVETLAFGWNTTGEPVVKARVILEGDDVREVRFEGGPG